MGAWLRVIADWLEDGVVYAVVIVASIPTYLLTMRRRRHARHDEDE